MTMAQFRSPFPSASILAVIFLLTSGIAGWGAMLRAGVERVEITPSTGVPLWGFSDRKSPATGTLDPLYARVLVLEAGSRSLALVTLDLGRPFGPTSLAWLRNATRAD